MNARHILFGVSILVGVWLTELGLAQCNRYCKLVQGVATYRYPKPRCYLLVDGSAMWEDGGGRPRAIWNPDGDPEANFVPQGETAVYERCETCRPLCCPDYNCFPQEAEVGGCKDFGARQTRWICEPPPPPPDSNAQ